MAEYLFNAVIVFILYLTATLRSKQVPIKVFCAVRIRTEPLVELIGISLRTEILFNEQTSEDSGF